MKKETEAAEEGREETVERAEVIIFSKAAFFTFAYHLSLGS